MSENKHRDIIDFPTYWRKEPLSKAEWELVNQLMRAHHASVFRQNVSTVVIANTAFGSADYSKAIAAGLMTIGGIHAPLWATMDLLNSENAVEWVEKIVADNRRVPGWGNSFIKEKPDELWMGVDLCLKVSGINSRFIKNIEAITDKLHELGKKIFPNPSAYTAAVALVLGIPPAMAPMLFVTGRLSGWSELIHKQIGGVS